MRVRKCKWPLPGTEEPRLVADWDAEVVGEDEFGTWLFCAAGEIHRRVDGTELKVPSDGVQLMPRTGWWWRDGRWIGIDICTPPERGPDGWSYTDLELDLVRRKDGTVVLVEEDEFERAGLPETVAARARAAAADLSEDDPVFARGWEWLAH
jgi:hypothetical protein